MLKLFTILIFNCFLISRISHISNVIFSKFLYNRNINLIYKMLKG